MQTIVVNYDAIEQILKSFPFEKVHAYMTLTNWRWSPEDKVPTMEQIKNLASWLLQVVAEANHRNPADEGQVQGTGGFYAYRFKWDGKYYYKLNFEPFHASNY